MPQNRILNCNGRSLDLCGVRLMGILNLTPDSFSDAGRFQCPDQALAQARQMAAEGADVIDVGGESTRPGAPEVPLQQELDRVMPVIERLVAEIPLPISIDTSKPEVMRSAIAAGAGLINDVRALQEPGALEVAREAGVPLCLMHMRGQPRTMQQAPDYRDVIAEISTFFAQRISACEAVGIPRERIILDPGFGFGKTLEHNLTLLRQLDRFQPLGQPLLVGVSRKSMIGALLGDREVSGRLYGSLAAALIAAQRGAAILRVHDVGPTADALKVLAALA